MFTIPASIDDAMSTLGGIDRLLNARQWERAAIVAAFVEVKDRPGRPVTTESRNNLMSTVDFGALGIAGLRNAETVQWYVETWLKQRPRPVPGEAIDMGGLPTWPGRYTDAAERPEKIGAARSPGQTAAAISADPTFAGKVLDKLTPEAKAELAKGLVKDAAVARAVVDDPQSHLAIGRAQAGRVADSAPRGPRAERDDADMTVVDLLLLGTAVQHLRDFMRKLAASGVTADRMPDAVQDSIRRSIAELDEHMRSITGLLDGSIRLHLTDDDLDALLEG